MRPTFKNAAPDTVLILCLILAGLKFTWDIESVYDLGIYDEAYYLFLGISWRDRAAAFVPQWGPIYSIWYAGLDSLLGSVSAYYWNARILCISLAICAYSIARFYSRPAVAALAAFPVLISYNNLTQWPKAGLFASILFLAGWSASLRFSKLGTRFFVAALGILFATFCRPEYFCLWFLWLALAGWQLTKMGAGDERIQAAR